MNAKGFTLIELIIVSSIIAILASLVVPSFSDIIRRQQVSGEANVLFSLVHLARSEAIKRNSVVTICKSNDADLCGGNWSDGWIVFQDNDKDGSRDIGEIKISSNTIGNDYQLSWSAFGSNNYIRFTQNGMTLSQNGTFKLCPADNNALLHGQSSLARPLSYDFPKIPMGMVSMMMLVGII